MAIEFYSVVLAERCQLEDFIWCQEQKKPFEKIEVRFNDAKMRSPYVTRV